MGKKVLGIIAVAAFIFGSVPQNNAVKNFVSAGTSACYCHDGDLWPW